MVTRTPSQPATATTHTGRPTVANAANTAPARLTEADRRPAGTDQAAPGSVAHGLAPLLRALIRDEVPVRFAFWDGSALGPEDGIGTLSIRSADAVRRILWAPGELGVARAFVSGDLTVEGDLFALLRVLHDASSRDLRRLGWRALPTVVAAARQLGVLGPPIPPPPEECRPAGRLHSPSRDAAVVSHHYDVGNQFYRLVLGPSMTYSCARFVTDDTTLEEAQSAKYELICRKLGLDRRPARLLDVGCGWGSMAMHAAERHGARVVGITLSREQADEAGRRVAEAGLGDRVEIRLQDYRELQGERYDAISSIGMFEHVGSARMTQYFQTLRSLLVPRGRLLNHAISKPGGSVLGPRSFVGRYVFPDGELLDVAEVVGAMQRTGFEVRDVESLREHYSRTLHHWVANLEEHWDEAVALVGRPRADIWRLYMAASANGFDDGGLAIHQVLGVVPDASGQSGMPPTRQGWDRPPPLTT
ncbi:MAG TPA: cyclopropane-fatty-acyl-phospholipid synthase family protein [Acidimicrobiales bacterium]|jgi:cyclopropane-fatty-acyl-phospholipid synthase|nr:cyclopropane-fatty-acyl-phospholipid synthase family protein [Acidimicrobiales bacterium]